MINILFIIYEFPPLNSGGSHRPYRFSKYLKEFNITATVITPKVAKKEIDSSWSKELEDIEIIYTDIDKSFRFENILTKNYINILNPEAKKWKKHLYPLLEELIIKKDFKAIYVTVPPFSMADLAVEISNKYNIPLILDMRDHWSHWNITPFTSYLHYKAILKTENRWFRDASAVLAVSDQMIVDFKNIHKNIEKDKFHTVRNSFSKEIEVIENEIEVRAVTLEKPLKIGYVGSFYYHPYQRELIFKKWWQKKPHQWFQYTPRKEDWLYRSPYFFFQTLKKLIDKYPNKAALIKVEFIGAKPPWLSEMIDEFDLNDMVELKGFLPHQKSLTFQKECDALLATSMKVIDGRDYCIAGKSYEYVYQQKPILAFMTEGTQKDFLEESGMALIFDSDRSDENVELLKSFIDREFTFSPNRESIKMLHARETTKKLANIIRRVIK